MDNFMENEKKFECDQCLESFNRNFSLTLHKTVIHSTKSLKCKESGKVFNLENELQSSQDFQEKIQKPTVVVDSSVKKLECKENGKDPNIKDFQCVICEKPFSTGCAEKMITTTSASIILTSEVVEAETLLQSIST